MTPTIGRIVLFRSADPTHDTSGALEVPAIITRVHSDTCVNLTVFADAAAPKAITSVCYAEDFERSGQHAGWRWPPRVEA